MSRFTESVEHYLEGLHVAVGACPGCDSCELEEDCTDEELQLAEEPWFSWWQCEGCGSTFGGDRHPAHALDGEGEILHLAVCTDCLLFLANGDEPDEPWYRTPSEWKQRVEA